MASRQANRSKAAGIALSISRRFVGAAACAGLGLANVHRLGAAPGTGGDSARFRATPGGTLTFGIWQSPDNLGPGFGGLESAGYINCQLFEPMIWLRPSFQTGKEYFPGLAESWEISPDATEYTFHQLVEQGNATSDPTQRAQIFVQAGKIVMEAAIVIPIYQQRAVSAGKKAIGDLFFSVSGAPIFQDVSLTG